MPETMEKVKQDRITWDSDFIRKWDWQKSSALHLKTQPWFLPPDKMQFGVLLGGDSLTVHIKALTLGLTGETEKFTSIDDLVQKWSVD